MTQSSTGQEVRTVEQITNDYAKNCQQAGHLAYQIEVANKEVARLQALLGSTMKNMENLNQEAASLPKPETKVEADGKSS